MRDLNIDKLNQLYRDAEEVDKRVFTNMRSNVLLSAGDHYTIKQKSYGNRGNSKASDKVKLRLTKNHIYRIVKVYHNSLVKGAPGVRPVPKNEMEMQDKKAAELNEAVWQDLKDRHQLNDKFSKWAKQFVSVAEKAVKIFWDPNKGQIVGYEPMIDPQTGEPVMQPVMGEDGQPQVNVNIDEMTGQPAVDPFTGQPIMEPVLEQVPDESKPVMSGDVCYESVPAYNLLRAPETKDMADSPYFIVRKMVDISEFRKRYAEIPEKMNMVKKAGDDDFVIFDSDKNSYSKSKNQCMVKELYIKPSIDVPNGYFYHYTEYGILEEGEIPFGAKLFPILWVGFDEYVSTPRAKSIVEVARPFQAEINRAASQEATHQITLGDDKLLYQSGSKLAQGALLPGVRGVAYSGAPPTILPGRTGAQFGDYGQRIEAELNRAVMLPSIESEKNVQLDPHTLLYRSIEQKAVFVPYVKKWERFLCDVAELSLNICREYLQDDALISAIGKSEQINIPEFKDASPLCYKISLVPVSDDAETLLGKQINFGYILQYLGNKLDPSSMGKILKNLPYVNNDDSFSDLTINDDNVENDMLALERGEQVQLSPFDDNVFYIKKLTHRIKKSDFKFLPQQVQQNYNQFLQQHQQEEARKTEEIRASQDGFIPVGGSMLTVDMYVDNPDKPENEPKKWRAPQKALEWLHDRLEVQGDTMEKLESMEQSNLAQISQQQQQLMMQKQQQDQQAMQQQQQMMAQMNGIQGPQALM